jgi:hypothetical protein
MDSSYYLKEFEGFYNYRDEKLFDKLMKAIRCGYIERLSYFKFKTTAISSAIFFINLG